MSTRNPQGIPVGPADAPCPQCRSPLPPGAGFCPECGTDLRAQAAGVGGGSIGALRDEPTGLLALAIIFVAGAILSYILWVPAAQPARLINAPLPTMTCVNETPGTTGMHLCAARVAAVTMIGPAVLAVLVLLLRKQLARGVARVSPRVPQGTEQLLGPLLATAIFLIIWAGTHRSTGGQTGILPHKMFPALIGAYTFAVVRYGPALQERWHRFFSWRDSFPTWARVIVTIAIPTAISLVITNQERVSNTAMKEQVVVLVGLGLAYLLMAPRGDISLSLSKIVPGTAEAPARRAP